MQDAFGWLGIPFNTPRVVVAIVIVFALRGLFVFWGKGYHFRIHTQLLGRLNEDLSGAIAGMRYEEYVKRNSGFFTHLVTKEVTRSVLAFYQVSTMIPLVVSISTYLILSLRVDWRFTILGGFFGALIALIFRTVITETAKASRALSAAESRMSSLVIQLLQSFKYLFSTGSLQPLQSKIGDCAHEVAVTGSRIGFLGAILPASSETVIVAFLGTMIYLQTDVFGRPVAMMLVPMLFLYRCMREGTVLQSSWQAFNQYVGGVDLLVNTIHELRSTAERPGGRAFQGIRQSLRLENVHFRYGNTAVLKNLQLEIPANSMVAFVGESGAGKSTLVDLLTSLMPPSEGRISADGVSYAELDRSALRAQIGYVTQESVVFDDTVANNVSLWRWQLDPNGAERVKRALQQANCGFVDKFPGGLQEVVGERGVRLSGGQRQRLSIARELYKNPALLVLDEATSALDSESERQVQESIDALKGTTTIVVIAHRLATVRNCDVVYVLREGNLVEQGAFDALKSQGGLFARMCQAQSL